jgi:hypothetical protein
MEQYEAFKKVREAQAKGDLIGTIHNSEVYELLGFHKVTTAGEKESWAAFTEALGSMTGDAPVNTRNDVEDLAQNFGNEREETGFRIGFHMAMRLCMEGMNGSVMI